MTSQVIPAPFTDCKPPVWASACGQDEYGFFADFSVATGPMYWDFLSQRMRWIPPGTFLMGSPEDEWRRSDNEQRHTVTLTRGFWLADTTCRQELWEAVMKDNPSHQNQGGESKRRKIIDKFWIDYARCMRCNICVEVCNFDAIAMNNTWSGHETSVYDRADLVLDLPQLLAQHKAGAINEWVAP